MSRKLERLGAFRRRAPDIKDPIVCFKSYSQLLFLQALPTLGSQSCKRQKTEASPNLWQNFSFIHLPLEGAREVYTLRMCVWHGCFT